MKLYHGMTSVCSIKVRLVLAEAGVAYEEQVLDLQKGDQFDPAYQRLNPAGVVPTLVDGSLIVVESSLIAEYLDKHYNGGALMPQSVAAEVTTRHWLLRSLALHAAINSLTFSTAMRESILASQSAEEIAAGLARMPNPLARDKRRDLLEHGLASGHVAQALTDLTGAMADMDRALQDQEWLAGDSFSLSDIAVLPYLDRLARLGFDGLWTDHPRVADWLTRAQARPSYQAEVAARIPADQARTMRARGSAQWPAVQAALAAL